MGKQTQSTGPEQGTKPGGCCSDGMDGWDRHPSSASEPNALPTAATKSWAQLHLLRLPPSRTDVRLFHMHYKYGAYNFLSRTVVS